MIDHYKVLGVSRIASRDEVHKAFLRLAARFSRDRDKLPGAQARFASVTEAHDVLFDPKRRNDYDFQVWKTPN